MDVSLFAVPCFFYLRAELHRTHKDQQQEHIAEHKMQFLDYIWKWGNSGTISLVLRLMQCFGRKSKCSGWCRTKHGREDEQNMKRKIPFCDLPGIAAAFLLCWNSGITLVSDSTTQHLSLLVNRIKYSYWKEKPAKRTSKFLQNCKNRSCQP